jgi:RNA polymerase sigma factor (sigma-70 family)
MFKEYSPFVFRTAYFLTRSDSLADDITQETFIKIIKGLHTYDSSKPIEPWIYKITINTTRNILRKQKWLRFVGVIPEAVQETKENIIEKTILQSEDEKELMKEINKLSQKLKEVIILHFYLGLKLKEVADILNIPVGTCKSRLNAALNKLRNQIPESEHKKMMEGGI